MSEWAINLLLSCTPIFQRLQLSMQAFFSTALQGSAIAPSPAALKSRDPLANHGHLGQPCIQVLQQTPAAEVSVAFRVLLWQSESALSAVHQAKC